MRRAELKRREGFYSGVKACVTFLHERADQMNDPHARAVLNAAAFALGLNKPVVTPPAEGGE